MTAFHCHLVLSVLIGFTVVAEPVRFNQDIRPILSKQCFQCHGPDANHRKAKLRLDQSGGDQGAYRNSGGSHALRPGSLEESALWHRINEEDPDEVMPPPSANKDPITPQEKELIRRWILDGASYEDFWSFVPPRYRTIPQPENPEWSAGPIDRFVLARMEAKGFKPSPPADKRTLIRRLSLDLTGLPPTPEEIHAFLADASPTAYEDLADRLLGKPQYGEHMARYWLDLVRFADTNGLHHDHYREMTPFRDWVIRAFNDNLPYDRFITDQLAGDLHPAPNQDQLIASGFNRLHLIIDVGTALPEESFTRNVVDRVTAVGTAFMGLTLQCAVCHDHKYDPITQKDFYQMYAFFNNFAGEPETGSRGTIDFKRGLQPPYIEFPTSEQTERRGRLAPIVQDLEKRLKVLKDEREAAKEKEVGEAIADEIQDKIEVLEAELEPVKMELESLLLSIPATLVMKEKEEVRPAFILKRGVYDQPGEAVQRDTPAFLPPMKKSGGLKTRLDLAEWLTDPQNPLTARVAVNRFWQQIFGVGLVKTSEDFGAQGEWPSHPDLLDYLALEFVNSGWDIKGLIRTIVLSETYRQSSETDPKTYRADPENRFLARGSRYRLDAEVIRDQVLSISGSMSAAMFGKSVKPPQPKGLWETVAMPYSYPRVYEADQGENTHRRSVYSFWKRALPHPQLTIFDAPTRENCIARRERTNTPLQALVLMNEPEYFKASIRLALQSLKWPDFSDSLRIQTLHERITSTLPDEEELRYLLQALAGFRHYYGNQKELAQALLENAGAASEPVPDPVEPAAWSMIVHSLFNLDVVKTRQ